MPNIQFNDPPHYNINFDRCPNEDCKLLLIEYVIHGVDPEGFLKALFENDLVSAFSQADCLNSELMREWATVLYSDLPRRCWGSKNHVASWITLGGVKGWAEELEQEKE